jgi:hypothetical protein
MPRSRSAPFRKEKAMFAHRFRVWFPAAAIALGLVCWSPASAGRALQAPRRPATFPFEFYRNAIWIEGRVNGSRPLHVQFDTAAGSCVLNRSIAGELGLKVLTEFDQPDAGSGDDPTRIAILSAVRLEYPGGVLELPQIAAIPLDDVARTYGTPIDAIVGYPLMMRDVVTVDFDARTITFSDPATFEYQGPGAILPLQGPEGVREPVVRAQITVPGAEPIAGNFLIDEPHPHCLLFATPFSRTHNLPAAAAKVAGRLVAGSATGVGGKTPYQVGRIETLELGGVSVRRPTAAFAESKGGAFARTDIAGIIGGEILRRFRLTFDYPHRRLILERGKSFGEPFDWDASGMKLRTAAGDFNCFDVTEVLEGGPAAEAGVRPGDVITGIDGKQGSGWTLWEVESLLKKANQEHALTIDRGGAPRLLTVRTRPLI